eukprot:CAMPEP_0181093024 /NCGR_PEP_ID=MMETSP1071-20121207/9227_1 /TAXON_ID=35127 /ORGANISM="Thalassiosira sp., Strain NH16" /LENGTH=36 /DNA_ID= /DNA_START= /DNA_END= /DNA_ORIENTATION=
MSAAESAIYKTGGYPALMKYKIWRAYETVKDGECCK